MCTHVIIVKKPTDTAQWHWSLFFILTIINNGRILCLATNRCTHQLSLVAHYCVPKSNLHHTNSSADIRLSFWRHFRNVTSCSCPVCMPIPPRPQGLTTAKRVIHSLFLGPINLCRDHCDRHNNAFRGLSLREAPPFETTKKLPALSLPILLAN